MIREGFNEPDHLRRSLTQRLRFVKMCADITLDLKGGYYEIDI